MKSRISKTLQKGTDADLFFLCKWHDACNKFTDVEGSTDLKWSLQPTATQAIMYTPESRDRIRNILHTTKLPLSAILNDHVANSKMKAAVFQPNIIDFDVSLATRNEDYLKLSECQQVTDSNSTSTNTGVIVAWFIFIIILVFLVAWSVVQFKFAN
jgi:hypothetical protein